MSQQQLDAFIGMVRADPAWQQEMEGAKLRLVGAHQGRAWEAIITPMRWWGIIITMKR
jgi:hypothetical protein